MSRTRSWCFTINNYSFANVSDVSSLDADYVVVGAERGEMGTPHLQGYVHFRNGKSLTAVSKLLPGAHLEPARGSPKQNQDYCKKQGDWFETGQIPSQGKRTDIDEVRELVQAKRPMIEILDVATSYQSAKFAELYRKYQPITPRTHVLACWIYGPSGSGKTHLAYEAVGSTPCYSKPGSKWWDGYDYQDCVLWDDFRCSDYPAQDLYRLLQPRPCRVENKGGSIEISSTLFLITSIKAPWEVYPGEDSIQLIRRLDLLVYTGNDPNERAYARSRIRMAPQVPHLVAKQ